MDRTRKARKIEIGTPGIIKALKQYDFKQAIAEYIWNGFDAMATTVQVWVNANPLGHISEIRIVDNGTGIPKPSLDSKFLPFLHSEKELELKAKTSAIHGKRGVGRLTFFNFAQEAVWKTVYEIDGKKFQYEIVINGANLEKYSSGEEIETSENVHTEVTFRGIHTITKDDFDRTIRPFLMKEFGWFLELNSAKDYFLEIDGEKFDYSPIILDEEGFPFEYDKKAFSIKFIQWKERPNDEYSRYYFIGSDNQEKIKKATTFNNKGDRFYHSVFIKGDYFDSWVAIDWPEDEPDKPPQLFKPDPIFKALMKKVENFLTEKRRPFLKRSGRRVVKEFREAGAFPEYSQSAWDAFRQEELENIISGVYQLEPKIFGKMSKEHKKIFAHFLNLLIDEGEMDKLLNIMGEVVNLKPEQRFELSELLKTVKMANIIKTIKFIEDRLNTLEQLKNLVFNEELGANERDHLQKLVESHYWIFGEQYHLVTAAEQRFETALQRFRTIVEEKNAPRQSIDHPSKDREMDIFMVRKDTKHDSVNSIIVELKHPKIRLGKKQYDQVKEYMQVILSADEFNASNMSWEFYLIGNKFDDTNYIKNEIENSRGHGERFLAYKLPNYKIYVKTWSEVLVDVEIRHQRLLEQLEIQRDITIKEGSTASDIVAEVSQNSAAILPTPNKK